MFCVPVLGNINKLTEGFKGPLLDLSSLLCPISLRPSLLPSLRPSLAFHNFNPMFSLLLYFPGFHLQITQGSHQVLVSTSKAVPDTQVDLCE